MFVGEKRRKALIVTGEASGDLHGANLIEAARKVDPALTFFGVGGNRMQTAGCEILIPGETISGHEADPYGRMVRPLLLSSNCHPRMNRVPGGEFGNPSARLSVRMIGRWLASTSGTSTVSRRPQAAQQKGRRKAHPIRRESLRVTLRLRVLRRADFLPNGKRKHTLARREIVW